MKILLLIFLIGCTSTQMQNEGITIINNSETRLAISPMLSDTSNMIYVTVGESVTINLNDLIIYGETRFKHRKDIINFLNINEAELGI